jgi:cyclophilin family peptidyl-prolyl cis-trans isomerase
VVAGFINQGGGYKLNSEGQIIAPTTAAPVVNEFKLSNVRGTMAMAKVSNHPNSATDQFFLNTADNSSILDGQDGGYTVIGQIVGVQGVNIGSASEGLAVMDAINAVPTFAFQSPFTSMPLINYTSGDAATPSNYVYINSITHYTAKTDGPATPIFSINTGNYAGPQTISLTDSTAGATIYYYLFGGSATTVTKYTGPFTVSSSQYVVAYATAPGYSSQSYDNYEYYDIE